LATQKTFISRESSPRPTSSPNDAHGLLEDQQKRSDKEFKRGVLR
jgi:hypothetical protein